MRNVTNKVFLGISLALSTIFPAYSLEPLAVVTSIPEAELDIPCPQSTPRVPKLLTMPEALILALRNNPAVHSARLQRINDKWALELADYAFQPHFTLSGNVSFIEGEQPGYLVNPGVTLNNRIGTQLSINNTTNLQGQQQEEITLVQPLLRGFGIVNEFPWLNAQDNEIIAQLNYKNSIIDIVTQVINTYRQVVQDENNLIVQQKTLKREEETAHQYELRVKAGKMAPSELLQEQANLANTQLDSLRQKNATQQDYQTLLDTLGLSPNSKLKVDTKINFRAYKPPSQEQAIEIALNNNVAYVSQKIQLNSTDRAVITAKNDLWWQLDVTAETSFATSSGTIPIINSFQELSTSSTGPSATIQLSIPIRDLDRKAALVNAKVALAQAQDSLEQSKRSLIRQVINSLNNLSNQLEQLKLAESGLELQRKNLAAEQIKQQYGQATALNVNIIQDQLLRQELDFVNSQISYLNSVTEFENLLGITLDEWGIKLRG